MLLGLGLLCLGATLLPSASVATVDEPPIAGAETSVTPALPGDFESDPGVLNDDPVIVEGPDESRLVDTASGTILVEPIIDP